jgi:hypothetical protein
VFSAGAAAADVHVHASLSYVKRSDGSYQRAHLRITRGGAVVLQATVRHLLQGDRLVRLFVRDLDADGEPEVTLDLFTGGAHCCTESVVYRYRPDLRRYRSVLHSWGNGAYRITQLDGRGVPELQSEDDRFAYAFTSFAFSVFPVRIWQFDHGRFLDITRRYPDAVRRDADHIWAAYRSLRRKRADVRGALAAWTADMQLLGRGDEASMQLQAADRRGELGPREGLAGWPQGKAYLRALNGFLRKLGYT